MSGANNIGFASLVFVSLLVVYSRNIAVVTGDLAKTNEEGDSLDENEGE